MAPRRSTVHVFLARSPPRSFCSSQASSWPRPASAAGLIVDAGAPNGSDDTATLQAILHAGDNVSLRPGQTYLLSERLNITQSNSGIITTGTPAVLYLKDTFNNVEPLQMWDTARVNSIAIRAEGSRRGSAEKIRLENFKIEKQHLDGTYVTAIWFRGVKNSTIVGLDITGFALGPIVALDSVNNVNIRSCYHPRLVGDLRQFVRQIPPAHGDRRRRQQTLEQRRCGRVDTA